MARSLYKIRNLDTNPIDFGTITVNAGEELIIFNRAKDYTANAGDILREKINQGLIELIRFDDTIMSIEDAHESITAFENNFGNLNPIALQDPVVVRDFYHVALRELEDEVYIENQTLEDEVLTSKFMLYCYAGLMLAAEDELNNMTPNATWTTALIDKYKAVLAAIKID